MCDGGAGLKRYKQTSDDLGLKFRFGPVTSEAALKLAAISKDFNPQFLVGEVARAEGLPNIPLHSLWVSSYVDAAIRLAAKARIAGLEICYHRSARQGESLTLEISTEVDGGIDTAIVFKVLDNRRKVVASGTSQLCLQDDSTE